MTNLTRREVISATTALLAGGMTGVVGRGAEADEPPKAVRANDSITLGFIGVGGMGSGLLDIFKKMPDVKVAMVCDVYEPNRLKAKEAAGGNPEAVEDFRRVLDRKDIDAVVVATPDHWHAIPTILACQAGKDVYCEKPLAFRIDEGRAMVTAAAKTNRVTQMGNLIHAGDNYRRVVEIVRSGVLGPISKTRVWMAADRRGLGRPADCPPPAGLNYDMWLGAAPKREFNPNRFLFNWRFHWDYAGGVLCDFVCHLVDLVHWAMDVEAPETITATGGRYVLDDNCDTPDTLEVVYHYAKGAKGFDLVWTQTDGSSHGFERMKQGIMFQGTEGTLVATYGNYTIIPEKQGVVFNLPEKTIKRSVGHHREWLDAIKTRDVCTCNFDYGHRLSSVGHLGNIALWTGEKLKWDAKNEKVTNHPEANVYLSRVEPRSPWLLPKV